MFIYFFRNQKTPFFLKTKGFYFKALKANSPNQLYGLDYEKKVIQCTRQIIPSGDVDKDMREIKLYFKDFKGKKPEKFTIGNID